MKPVIHGRGDSQGDERPFAPVAAPVDRSDQILHAVGESLGLKDLAIDDTAMGPHDRIARTGENLQVGVDRTRARPQLADKTVMQALKAGLASLGEIEIGKGAPGCDGQVAYPGVTDLAYPANQARERMAWNSIREQEVDVLLRGNSVQGFAHHTPPALWLDSSLDISHGHQSFILVSYKG